MNMLKRFSILAMGVLVLSLTACNTMEGLGEDVQKGGEHLEDAAKKSH